MQRKGNLLKNKVFSVTHWHPMWPPTDPAVQCPIHWWQNALFINSLTDNRCMPWTWLVLMQFLFKFHMLKLFVLKLKGDILNDIFLLIYACPFYNLESEFQKKRILKQPIKNTIVSFSAFLKQVFWLNR